MSGDSSNAAATDQEIKGNKEEDPDDSLQFLLSYINEAQARIATKSEMRTKNLNAVLQRPSETYFSKLDSNLKKNTTFVKKVRNFTAIQFDGLLKDMTNLNLTKYISEVAAAIVEAKLKMTDIPYAVKFCSALHQIYADFSIFLMENWQKIFSFKPGEKISNLSKLRVDLRFYAELVNAGLWSNKTAYTLLGNALTFLINMDKEDHYNISIIVSFCKHCGEDYAGLVPRKIKQLSEKHNSEIPKSDFLSPERQQNVRSLLKEYYMSLCKHLEKDFKEMQEFERQNSRILQTKGELSQERKEKLESIKSAYDKLHSTAENFAEILDEDLPVFDVPIVKQDENLIISAHSSELTEDGSGLAQTVESVWCDPETQKFYCDLPDLHTFLPASCYPQQTQQQSTKETEDKTTTEEELDKEITVDEESEEESEKIEEPVQEEEPEDVIPTTASNKIVLDAFMNNLPNCVNREMIDNAAVDFLLTLNTKHNRRRLVKVLFGVNRTRLDLLPFYARFVAILRPALPDVGTELCQMLLKDFKYHVSKKDQINIESKIKVVRYIGELVKFGLCPKIEALYALKVLLNDFSHHHIEMACNLLEVCGRYLFCHPDSHHRMKVYLEQMMRKKSVLALDSRYVTQIENAYYYVNPPETITIHKKERPVLHQFIRKLFFQDLQKNTTDKVLRLMRKLNWNDEEVAAYATKCLTAAHNLKYFNIRCLANLLAGLVAYQEEVGTRVVDGVLEDIRLGMEVNLPKFNQRRVAQVKYLGELYNYRMVESADIFKVLYSLISFGVTMDYAIPSPLDPPDHLFRIRLACVLLDTCGMYFNSGTSKKRLDYFLVFLQAYYWFKRSDQLWQPAPEGGGATFPVSIEFLMRDTLLSLRPKLKMLKSYEQCQEEVQKIGKILGIENTITNVSSSAEDKNRLATITETDGDGDEENSEAEGASANVADDTTTEDDISAYGDGESDEEEETENSSSGAAVATNPDELEKMIPSGPRKIECSEDEDFVNALDRMVSENIQERMRESVKPNQIDIPVPLMAKQPKKNYEQLQETAESKSETMDFVLMLKKGNKQQYRSFQADVDSELAQNLRDQEMAQREEKERVKQLTLNITERLEEEDYQEMMQQQQRPSVMNLNRERKRYQHPKGAPDADLIFGPKKFH